MRVISGLYGGRTIVSATGPGLRPSTDKVRQAMFSMLASRGMDFSGSKVFDCFAGSGSLGIESLSRGADLVWFVEKGKTPARIIRDNLLKLKIPAGNYKVLSQDIFSLLKKKAHTEFDLVFLDPPYGKGMVRAALELLINNDWISPDGFVLAEMEKEVEPDFGFDCLSLLTDRAYGQTRIAIWQS